MNNCRICDNENLELILDLGFHPPSDAFLTEDKLNKPEVYYPLQLMYCNQCGLAQLSYVVPRETLFGNDYPYTTGINKAGIDHFHDMAKDIIKDYHIVETDFILDIGGNDGTLLEAFDMWGCTVLNVDPSGVDCGVSLWKGYWGVGTASAILARTHKKAKVILATNVFAHVDDVHDFMKGVDILLDDDGIFIIESPSLDAMIQYDQFDQIYHEHLSYWNEKSMGYLMFKYAMKIKRCEYTDFHGGSNRYFIKRMVN